MEWKPLIMYVQIDVDAKSILIILNSRSLKQLLQNNAYRSTFNINLDVERCNDYIFDKLHE